MYSLHENYYHRQCYFEREQVPTQSVMKNKMQVPLAHVYFKSMNWKLKVLAGLEPPMQGGGPEWYMPPDELLACRAVLHPEQHEVLKKLSHEGIYLYGEKILKKYYKSLQREKEQALHENDLKWKKSIEDSNRRQYEESSKRQAFLNSSKIKEAFHEFEMIYRTATTSIETLIFDSAIQEIERVREEAYQKMKKKFEKLVHKQATMLYDKYNDMLMREKARLKGEFVKEVDTIHTDTSNQLHDINVEKHVAVEKLRKYLECQNLACQIYVALKEREACKKELELSKYEHNKKMKEMTRELEMKNFEIQNEREEEIKRQKFNAIWKNKVCHVVKKFQMFVEYCLKLLPQHAEFFTNMEKLMLLQLNEAIDNPSTESIIENSIEHPVLIPRPHPFFLCCDRGFKPKLDETLCPKHCTSSAAQFPVIVVNKRFLYAACDNFQMYSEKINDFILGKRGDPIDFEDDHDYTYDVPFKYTSETAIEELKLESSLMQVLQHEVSNIKQVPIECCVCKIPNCLCSPTRPSRVSLPPMGPVTPEEPPPEGKKIEPRSEELKVHREPKWESYMEYVLPKRCKCAKRAKKHLNEKLPAYMKNMSPYDVPDLPNYEPCNLEDIKRLVKNSRSSYEKKQSVDISDKIVFPTTRDMGTQWSDHEFDILCTCFSESELANVLDKAMRDSMLFDPDKVGKRCSIVRLSARPSDMGKTASTFATDRAYSLRKLLDNDLELEQIFAKESCDKL